MKRIRHLTVKLLLAVMACFVTHDYVTGQSDVVLKERSVHLFTQQANSVPIVLEHQAFHMLALNEWADQGVTYVTPSKLQFAYMLRIEERPSNPPYTPPKNA
ncbi:hypothetical protein [Hydrogenimonas sp.]